jgi:hypothetical protein
MIDQYPLSNLLSIRTLYVRKYASPFAPRSRDHKGTGERSFLENCSILTEIWSIQNMH